MPLVFALDTQARGGSTERQIDFKLGLLGDRAVVVECAPHGEIREAIANIDIHSMGNFDEVLVASRRERVGVCGGYIGE